ncbi:MAG: hypothetical protein JO167_13250 [Alphaproteobacteria bacterium]|nr:hypothetical protein [Alphaproteobacteria bacterium]
MNAEQLALFARPRAAEVLPHGRIRQVYDVTNCPGMTIVWEGFKVDAGGEFETVSQTYHLTTGDVYETPDEALVAWDAKQNDHAIVEALGEALLRFRFGLVRPLWSERTPKLKEGWIANARCFRRLLNGLGFDIVRLERQG